MAQLTREQKKFIVQELACWRGATEVAEAVIERWPELEGTIDRRQVWKYHPDRGTIGQSLSAIFDATRAAFIDEVGSLGIAHRAWRLREIQDTVDRAKRMGNEALKLTAIEQAAKEVGGMYTNSRKLEHSGEVKTPSLTVVLHKEPSDA